MSEEQFDARPVVGRVELQPTEDELRMLQSLRERNAVAAAPVVEPPAPVEEPPVAAPVADVVTEPAPAPQPQPLVMGDLDTPELTQGLDAPAPQVDPADEPMPTNRRQLKAIAYRLTPTIAHRQETSELLTETVLLQIPGLSSFGIPPEHAEQELNTLLEGATFDPIERRWVYVSAEQEAAAETISVAANNHAPKYSNGENAQTRALANPDACWDQQVQLKDGTQMSLVRSHGNQDNSALGRIRRAKGSGVPVTLFMPKSGFFVTYRTPHEREFCDLDIRMASETGILGVSSYGLLMSASSGVYMKHMLESTLQYVTETSLNLDGRDMSTAILANLDMLDAHLFVLGPIIAKYPGGLPWEIICPRSDCGHTEPLLLNLARCIRAGNGLFSSEQLDFIVRTRGKLVTLDEVAKYREFAKVPDSHVFTKALATGLSIAVEWKHTVALEFFEHAEGWIETNNKITNAAMMEQTDEKTREAHLRIVADQRRLVRNLHFIGAIVVTDTDGTTERVEERGRIIEILEDMSEDKLYVLAFEAALANYIEDSRLTIFGYMAQECPRCKNNPNPIESGPYRGLVPLAPDRIFFTLSRVVSAMQNQLATQFANIG